MVWVATILMLMLQEPKLVTSISTASSAGATGILPLSAATLADAIADGQSENSKAMELSIPMAVLLKARGPAALQSPDVMARFNRYRAAPFSANVLSPYVRAAVESAEAKRKYLPPPTPDLAALNEGKVVIYVSPGSDFTTVDAIENVVIKRDGQVIRPLKADVKPRTVQNRLGASRESASGHFTFDFSAFEPSKPITLVFIGKGGNWEWEMSAEELALMR